MNVGARAVVLVLAIGVAALLLSSRDSGSSPASQIAAVNAARASLEAAHPAPPDPTQIALKEVKLDFDWDKVGFENVLELNVRITNPTARAIKDVQITCDGYAESGTKIDHNVRTLYVQVPAKGKKSVEKFNMGFLNTQVKRVGCAIVNLTVE